jgi:hypothetical protein
MSQGLYTHTTRATGVILTAAIYNGDHLNHILNQNPLMTGALSDDVAQMRATFDPGLVGTENFPGSLGQELEAIRFCIKRLSATAQWYEEPAGLIGGTHVFISNTGVSAGPSFEVSGGPFYNMDWADAITGVAKLWVGTNTDADDMEVRFLYPGTANSIFGVQSTGGGTIFGDVIATDTEAKAGTLNTKIITPAGAQSAITARIATDAEAQAGTNNLHLMTPMRTAAAITKQANSKFHMRHDTASGGGGGTFTSGAWQVQPIGTTVTNNIVGTTLNTSTHQITLPSGTYDVDAVVGGEDCGVHQAVLHNLTANATSLVGTNASSGNAAGGSHIKTDSHIRGRVVLSVISVFELRHRCSVTGTYGSANSFGEREIYADIIFKKVA